MPNTVRHKRREHRQLRAHRRDPLVAAGPRQLEAERTRVTTFTDTEAAAVHRFAVESLKERAPDLSASETVQEHQRRGVYLAAAVLLLGLLLVPILTLSILMGLATLVYTGVLFYRVLIFRRGASGGASHVVTDLDALSLPDAELPVYTVLVPAYDEPEVVPRLLRSLEAIDYPRDKLEVKLLLEADDEATYNAVLQLRPGTWIDVVRVPESEPRTKPKACNVGLMIATGEFVTIYDAEDRPDPLQLRRAVVAFRRSPDLDCVQARLDYDNAGQNRITSWFTAEYGAWFSQLLPGLVALGAPLPLGGTSNHIRRSVLDDVGGWDPFNVTEDADLGIRLARLGHRVEVLESVTYEEANSDFVNWVKQRSRWHKGYLQTWLVHMRSPRRLYADLGLRGFVGFNLFVGGTPILALLNPIFWTMTAVWFLAQPSLIERIFPAPVYYPALACWAFGNFLVVYLGVVGVRLNDKPELTLNALLSPLYWLMMSIAAIKAATQLVRNPFHWEKTKHGLADPVVVAPPRPVRVRRRIRSVAPAPAAATATATQSLS